MATIQEKLSNKTTTSDPTGYYWVVVDAGGGNYVDRKISDTDLLNSFSSQIQHIMNTQQYVDQTASFTHALLADTKLEGIDFRVSTGSCTVKVGTSSGDDDLLSSRTLTVRDQDYNFPLGLSWKTAKTIYITITGTVTLDCDVNFRSNRF